MKTVTLKEASVIEVKTNMGVMPLIDYFDIYASQNGFVDVYDMVAQKCSPPGYNIIQTD